MVVVVVVAIELVVSAQGTPELVGIGLALSFSGSKSSSSKLELVVSKLIRSLESSDSVARLDLWCFPGGEVPDLDVRVMDGAVVVVVALASATSTLEFRLTAGDLKSARCCSSCSRFISDEEFELVGLRLSEGLRTSLLLVL